LYQNYCKNLFTKLRDEKINFSKFMDENQNHANFRDENNILAKNIYALAKEMYNKKQKISS